MSDGGVIEYPEENRRRDVHGNTEEIRRIGEEGWEEWVDIFAKHPTKKVKIGEKFVNIDARMVSLVEGCQKFGVVTCYCCQGDERDPSNGRHLRAYISFDTKKNTKAVLLNILKAHLEISGSVKNDACDHELTTNKNNMLIVRFPSSDIEKFTETLLRLFASE